MPIQWRDLMSVDGGLIHRDHQALIAIINQFENVAPEHAARQQLQTILMDLHNYSKRHFRREEELQNSISYPEYEPHQLEHLRLIELLARVQTQFSESNENELSAVHKHMTNFLRRWLIEHVIKSDLRMKPFAGQFQTGSMRSLHDLENLRDLKIVIVDDQSFMRNTIMEMLRGIEHTFAINIAGAGEAALHLIAEMKPELILCDINQEPMDRLQVIEDLRKHANPSLRDTPVIVLTGRADEGAVQKAARLNIQGYFVKPVSPLQIEQKLHVIFRGRRPSRSAAGTLAAVQT